MRHVSGIGVATLTECATLYVDAEGVFAARAAGGMMGEVFHDVVLVVAGGATDGVGGRNEFDTADHLGRGTGGGNVVLVLGVY